MKDKSGDHCYLQEREQKEMPFLILNKLKQKCNSVSFESIFLPTMRVACCVLNQPASHTHLVDGRIYALNEGVKYQKPDER